MLTPEGRITLNGRTLIRTGPDGRQEHELASDIEVLGAYRTYFGIELAQAPVVKHPVA